MHRTQKYSLIPLFTMSILLSITIATPALALEEAFLGRSHTISMVASTVPTNGDVHPYGVMVIPRTVGNLKHGNVLVSNFHARSNFQGTGTTLVQVAPGGTATLFAQIDASKLPGACPGGVGLTTALAVLQRGWVIVGSLPTSDGTAATAKAGCLLVLDSSGKVVETIAGGPINGPWDMTVLDVGDYAWLFVTNVLNRTVAGKGAVVREGSVVRINLSVPFLANGSPKVLKETVIGSAFPERTDPESLAIGPTGLGLFGDTLFVADSVSNRIAAIPYAITRQTSASTGTTISVDHSLKDPLGLTVTRDGYILTVNGNDGNLVVTLLDGRQVNRIALSNPTTGQPSMVTGAGCLFGLALVPSTWNLYFVDDCSNTLKLLSR